MNDTNILSKFDYPKGYKKLRELNLTDFEFWYFIPDDQLPKRFVGMSQRYPTRKYIPYARRDDCDDIACFEYGKGETVYIVHDFAGAGFEERKCYSNIWGWLKDAIDELISENPI